MSDLPDKIDDEAKLLILEKKAEAAAKVTVAAGYAVVWTPLVYLVLKFAAAMNGVQFEVDGHIVEVSLGAIGTIIAYAFGQGIARRLLH